MSPPTVILYALPDEAKYFGKEFERRSVAPRDRPLEDAEPVSPQFGGVVAYRIGAGLERARRNTAAALDLLGPVRSVLIVGFAGGLETGLGPGDIAVGEEVSTGPGSVALRADRSLLEAVAHVTVVGARCVRGRITSASGVIGTAAEKREMARATGAIAVDTESAAAAAVIEERGGAWIAVRVITDGPEDDLPFDFNAESLQADGDPYGGVDRSKTVVLALQHPWKIPALIRLGLRANRAARNLALFLHALMPQLAR
ncbi:MAG TPA: hypothetical protein VKT77_14990 [Chthonomonadaceae bacterium]|nr:hypothetical protein [Chthonomonadaceae bacterium]